MENKHFYKKTIVVSIFILAAAIMTYVGLNEVFAQSTGNQSTSAASGNQSTSAASGNQSTSAASGNQSTSAASGNQSQFLKKAETLKKLENITGSNQKILAQNKIISNPNNTLGNSLATNQFQSY